MYLELNEGFKLCGTTYDVFILYIYQKNKIEFQSINKEAFDILSLCDGSNTLEDVTNKLSIYYNDSKINIINNITDFIEQCKTLNIIKTNTIRRVGNSTTLSSKMYSAIPLMLTLEITRKCNLKCPHCYAEGGDKTDN